MPRPTVKERARMFASKARPSIEGQGGNAALYAVAAGVVIGFGLDDGDAFELLCEYNGRSCSPAWPESELRRTLKNARRAADKDPGAVGELARADGDGFIPRSPANTPPSAGKPKQRGPAPPSGRPAPDKARTPRTPVFNVHSQVGVGRCAAPRTIRTLQIQPRPYEEKKESPDKKECEKVWSEVSPVLREPQKVSPRPKLTTATLGSEPNCTLIWCETGQVIREGRVIGNIKFKRK